MNGVLKKLLIALLIFETVFNPFLNSSKTQIAFAQEDSGWETFNIEGGAFIDLHKKAWDPNYKGSMDSDEDMALCLEKNNWVPESIRESFAQCLIGQLVLYMEQKNFLKKYWIYLFKISLLTSLQQSTKPYHILLV